MNKDVLSQKEAQVEEATEIMKSANTLLFVDYLGLTVDEATNMRAELRDSDSNMKVIKNSILKRAAEKAGLSDVDASMFVGPTALVYSSEDAVAPAKVAVKYADLVEPVEIKGGYVEGKATSVDEIKQVAKMPGRQELYGMLASVLKAPMRKVAYTFQALADKKAEDGDGSAA